MNFKPKNCIAYSETNKRFSIVFTIMILISVFVIISSFTVGYYKIPVKDIIPVIFKGDTNSNSYNIIMNIRLPRIIAAFSIGSALAVSGSAYQGMFKNPLVSPDIFGVSAGAGLGASLAITMDLPYFYVQITAFIFGIVSVLLCYFTAHRVQFGQTISLILAGMMIQALANAFTTLLKYVADPNNTLAEITFWLMGSLTKVDRESLLFSIVPMIIGFIILFSMRYRLNVLTLGDDEAKSMGINPKKTRIIAVAGATLLSASAVCLGGLIGFVGLMVPHVARHFVGPQYKRLLPVAFLMGGCFLLIMDNIARSALTMEIPLGVITAFIGAPFFLYLIAVQGAGKQ